MSEDQKNKDGRERQPSIGYGNDLQSEPNDNDESSFGPPLPYDARTLKARKRWDKDGGKTFGISGHLNQILLSRKADRQCDRCRSPKQ